MAGDPKSGLTTEQQMLLQQLSAQPVVCPPTEDLVVLWMKRLIMRNGLSWNITAKGQSLLAGESAEAIFPRLADQP